MAEGINTEIEKNYQSTTYNDRDLKINLVNDVIMDPRKEPPK